jgi:phosphorylcholine metabolism protein LicD
MFKKDKGYLSCLCFGHRSPFKIVYGLKSVFDDLIELDFEGKRFFAFADIEAYLAYAYDGEYRKYPPVHTRFARHLPGDNELNNLYNTF